MRARRVAIALTVTLLVAACRPGTPDLGFSPSLSVPLGPSPAVPVQLVPRAGGGVVATGNVTRPLTLVGPNGVVASDWGASLPTDCRRISRAVSSGTSILMTCSPVPTSGQETWQLWRVTEAGELDPSFGGGDGIVDVPAALQSFDVAPLPGGRALGLGRAAQLQSPTAVTPLVAIVYSATGAVVSTSELPIPLPIPQLPSGFTWGIAAFVTPTPTGVAAVETLAALSGSFNPNVWRVQHFDVQGAVLDDPTFSHGGSSGSAVGSDQVIGLVGLRDGRTAVAYRRQIVDVEAHFASTFYALSMFLPTGGFDPRFGTGGSRELTDPQGGTLDATSLSATNGDRFLVVAGRANGVAEVVRYDATTGALDPTFGNDGHAGTTIRTIDAVASRLGDFDQLYLGGQDHEGRPAVARMWNQLAP
jgi:hypothetical protein